MYCGAGEPGGGHRAGVRPGRLPALPASPRGKAPRDPGWAAAALGPGHPPGRRGTAGAARESRPWGHQRRGLCGSRLVCLRLNWALCVWIHLEAPVTSLAVWGLRNAKSRRQLRRKRKPVLFSAGLNGLFRLNLICGNAGETKSQLCPGCLSPECALRGAGPGCRPVVSGLGTVFRARFMPFLCH